MNIAGLQQWLNTRGQSVVVDGEAGPFTRSAIIAAFTNASAPAITDDQIEATAASLGCTAKQIRAVATVESGGSAYDKQGHPKILFERHVFYRLTKGAYGVTIYSDPNHGGYGEDSWTKLTLAASRNPDAAFMACSWGKFQIMGEHWLELDYPSPIDMAFSTVPSELGSYDMLARFIQCERLQDALRALSTNPVTCRMFASRYNGPNYQQNRYDEKLAEAMA